MVAAVDDRGSALEAFHEIAKEVRLVWVVDLLNASFGRNAAVICLTRKKKKRQLRIDRYCFGQGSEEIERRALTPMTWSSCFDAWRFFSAPFPALAPEGFGAIADGCSASAISGCLVRSESAHFGCHITCQGAKVRHIAAAWRAIWWKLEVRKGAEWRLNRCSHSGLGCLMTIDLPVGWGPMAGSVTAHRSHIESRVRH